MKKLFPLAALGIASSLFLVSCAPLNSSAIRHSEGQPVFTSPDTWTSGGYYSGFVSSRPSAHGYNANSAAPC